MKREGCFECELRKQRLKYKKILTKAREIAKKENRTITVYRAESGELTLEAIGEPDRYVTPFM